MNKPLLYEKGAGIPRVISIAHPQQICKKCSGRNCEGHTNENTAHNIDRTTWGSYLLTKTQSFLYRQNK